MAKAAAGPAPGAAAARAGRARPCLTPSFDDARRRCGHCKMLAPEMKKLGEALEKEAALKSRLVVAKARPRPAGSRDPAGGGRRGWRRAG
jgi:hypothetical protein